MGIIANLKEGSTCIQLTFYIQSKKNKIGEKNNINTYKQLSFGILLIKKRTVFGGQVYGYIIYVVPAALTSTVAP